MVLKALNHSLRRDILLFLSNLNRPSSFSELLETMKLSSKASGQFSYHLKLLTDANLIEKDSSEDNKYLLTNLGIRATSMLDLVDSSSESSLAQSITNAFKDLSPKEQIYLGFQATPLGLFALSFSSLEQEVFPLFLSILWITFSSLVLLIYFLVAYRSLQSFLALLTLSSVIFLVFIPNNHKYIGSIYFLNLIGSFMIINTLYIGFLGILDYLSIITGIIMIILAIIISIQLYKKKNGFIE
jgi:DNA-binding transcriptional ArsR family regulator